MRQKMVILIGLFILVLFQISFVSSLFFPGPAPNLLLILLVFLSSRMRPWQIWKFILIVGVFLDVFLFLPLGTDSLAFLLIFLAVKILERKFFIIHVTWRFIILVVLVAFCTWMYELILPFIFYAVKAKSLYGYNFGGIDRELGLMILYNAVLFGILYRPFRKIEDFFVLRYQPA